MESKEVQQFKQLMKRAAQQPREIETAFYCILGGFAFDNCDTTGLAKALGGESKGFYKRVIRELRRQESKFIRINDPEIIEAAVVWCRRNMPIFLGQREGASV